MRNNLRTGNFQSYELF